MFGGTCGRHLDAVSRRHIASNPVSKCVLRVQSSTVEYNVYSSAVSCREGSLGQIYCVCF